MSHLDVHHDGGDATTAELLASNPAIGQTIDVDALRAEVRRLRRECEQLEQDRDHWIQCFEHTVESES